MVDVKQLLSVLPPFGNYSETIVDEQDVNDIMNEVYDSYLFFSPDYDLIYQYFDTGNTLSTVRGLFDFCKRNIAYKVESEEDQTTRSPSAILTFGKVGGDCKHYACFIGGVLGAIARNTNQKFQWAFRYANYDQFSDVPGHVFIVVWFNNSEYWVDPVLSKFNERYQPVDYIDEKITEPMLRRISGIQENNAIGLESMYNNPQAAAILATIPNNIDIPYDLHQALTTLMDAGIMSPMGDIDEDILNAKKAHGNQSPNDIDHAVLVIQDYAQDAVDENAAMGSFFGDVFKFVQHNAALLGMQVPRAAFLGLVRLNAFGYATKLDRALSYQDTKDKLSDLWERVGGKFSELENSIGIGKSKKAILSGAGIGCGCNGGCKGNSIGCVETVSAAACLIASAALIVAAIMPVITSLLKKHNDPVASTIPLDPNTGLPVGYNSGSGIVTWLQSNPLIVIAGILGIGYLLTSKTFK